MSAAKLKELLSVDLPEVTEGLGTFLSVAKMQLAATDIGFRTITKVNENALRKRGQDLVPKLLQIMAEEEARLQSRTIEH